MSYLTKERLFDAIDNHLQVLRGRSLSSLVHGKACVVTVFVEECGKIHSFIAETTYANQHNVFRLLESKFVGAGKRLVGAIVSTVRESAIHQDRFIVASVAADLSRIFHVVDRVAADWEVTCDREAYGTWGQPSWDKESMTTFLDRIVRK